MIGVYSKSTNKLNFIDVDSIFPMNQKIKKLEEAANKVELKIGEINKRQEYMVNKQQLVKDFGTNKAKKQMTNLKTNILSEDNISSVNVTKQILGETAKAQGSVIKHNIEELLQSKMENMKEILPPFNAETEVAKEIFLQESSNYLY